MRYFFKKRAIRDRLLDKRYPFIKYVIILLGAWLFLWFNIHFVLGNPSLDSIIHSDAYDIWALSFLLFPLYIAIFFIKSGTFKRTVLNRVNVFLLAVSIATTILIYPTFMRDWLLDLLLSNVLFYLSTLLVVAGFLLSLLYVPLNLKLVPWIRNIILVFMGMAPILITLFILTQSDVTNPVIVMLSLVNLLETFLNLRTYTLSGEQYSTRKYVIGGGVIVTFVYMSYVFGVPPVTSLVIATSYALVAGTYVHEQAGS